MLNIADQHDADDQKVKSTTIYESMVIFQRMVSFFRHWPLPFRLFTKTARPIMLVIENGGGVFDEKLADLSQPDGTRYRNRFIHRLS